MTNNGFTNGDSIPSSGAGSFYETQWAPEVLKHLSRALSVHVRRLHQEGLPVPREVEELAVFLARLARIRQDPPAPAGELERVHDARMPDRLLVTKAEAAERLGVSVRTIERLVAAGRLPQVHVERLARFRVSDLETFVDSLAEGQAPDGNSGNHHDLPG